jgi:hypothetical protein
VVQLYSYFFIFEAKHSHSNHHPSRCSLQSLPMKNRKRIFVTIGAIELKIEFFQLCVVSSSALPISGRVYRERAMEENEIYSFMKQFGVPSVRVLFLFQEECIENVDREKRFYFIITSLSLFATLLFTIKRYI